MFKEMTIEEYNENKKICLFVFKKYFRNYSKYKDDLIQCGLINIAKNIEKFDKEKSSLLNFKIQYIKYGMGDFINSVFYKSRNVRDKLKNLRLDVNTISFDTVISENEDLKVSDTIEDIEMKDYFDNIANNDCLRQCIDNALKQVCRYKEPGLNTLFNYERGYTVRKRKENFNQRKYDIIKYYLKCQNITETAKKFNVSKQLVSQCKIYFAKCLKDELIKNCYFD